MFEQTTRVDFYASRKSALSALQNQKKYKSQYKLPVSVDQIFTTSTTTAMATSLFESP